MGGKDLSIMKKKKVTRFLEKTLEKGDNIFRKKSHDSLTEKWYNIWGKVEIFKNVNVLRKSHECRGNSWKVFCNKKQTVTNFFYKNKPHDT